MAGNRDVSTQIKYAIDVTQKGLQQAVALTRDLGATSKSAQTAVDTSMKMIQAQYSALAKVAAQADGAVARSAVTASAEVNKALDRQIVKLRETGASYTAIIAKQSELKVSAAQLAASIEASSKREIAAMQAARLEADRGIRQRLGLNREIHSAERGGVRAMIPEGFRGGLGPAGLAGGLAAFMSIEGIKSAVESTVQRVNVAKQLQIGGLTGAESQTLAASTSALGVAPTAAAQALKALSRQTTGALDLNHTGKPNVAAEHAFKALGITQKQVAATSGDLYKTLGLVADRIAHGTHGAQQYAAASTLLGRGFSQLNPLLADGAKGLEEQAKWAEKYGLIAKGAGAHGLEELHKKQIELKFANMGLQQSIATNLTPVLLKLLPVLTDVSHVVGSTLGPAIKVVKGAFDAIPGPVKDFLKVAGGTGLVMLGVGKALGAVTAALEIMKAAALSNPLVLIAAAVAGAAYLIYKNWGPISRFFEKLWKDISGFFTGAWHDISSTVQHGAHDAAHWITTAFDDAVNFVSGLPGKFLNLGKGIVDGIVNGVKSAPGALIDAIMGLLPGPLKGLITGAGGFIGKLIGGNRAGGIIGYAAGGLVPAMVSPGEQVIYGNRSAMVPGSPVAADSVFAMLPAGAAVMTGHGQAMMGMGASLDEALSMQLPHFAPGGRVTDSSGWSFPVAGGHKGRHAGGPRLRYVHHQPVGVMDEAQWQAYQLTHAKASSKNVGWTSVGASIDDFTGGPLIPGFTPQSNHGMSFAELLLGGVNKNLHPSLAELFGLGRALPGGFPLDVRYGGKEFTGAIKVDSGSGLPGDAHRKIDLERPLARYLGFPGTGDVQVRPHGGASGALKAADTAAKAAAKAAPTLANAISAFTPQSAFGEGLQAGLSGQTIMDTLRSGALSTLIGDVAINKSGLIGGSQPITSSISAAGAYRGRLGAMVAKAGQIASRNYRYKWGGGHDAAFSPAYDCSGAVSAVLHAGGALSSPLVSGQLMGWGQKGRGKQVSVFSSPTHTFMQLGGRYFGTSAQNPGGGANWIARFPENMPAVTHPPGMRRGGIAGRRNPLSPLPPTTVVTRTVGALLGQADSADVGALVATLAGELENVHKLTVASLAGLVRQLQHHTRKGLSAIQGRRLDDSLAAISLEIGNRIGLQLTDAQAQVDKIARGGHHAIAQATLAGVDPTSAAGLALGAQLDKQTVQGLNSQVGVLNNALATAKKYGDKASIKTVTDQLNTALGALDDAMVTSLNDWRAAVEKVSQDRVDKAGQALTLAQGAEQTLSLRQQLAGADQSPGASLDMAAFIRSQIEPALQSVVEARQQQLQSDASLGDVVKVMQDQVALQSANNDLLSAQVDESKLIKDASQKSAAALKAQGGQLAFNYAGNNYTDAQLTSLSAGV